MNLLQMERIWANVLSRNTLVREREMPDSVATSRATFAFHAYGSSVVRLSINVESTGLRAAFQFLLSEGSTQEKQSAVPQIESSTCTVPPRQSVPKRVLCNTGSREENVRVKLSSSCWLRPLLRFKESCDSTIGFLQSPKSNIERYATSR